MFRLLYHIFGEISMLKRIFSVFFAFLLTFLLVLPVFNVSAYEVNGFEITAKSGMLVSLDTGEVLYSKNADKKIYQKQLWET